MDEERSIKDFEMILVFCYIVDLTASTNPTSTPEIDFPIPELELPPTALGASVPPPPVVGAVPIPLPGRDEPEGVVFAPDPVLGRRRRGHEHENGRTVATINTLFNGEDGSKKGRMALHPLEAAASE